MNLTKSRASGGDDKKRRGRRRRRRKSFVSLELPYFHTLFATHRQMCDCAFYGIRFIAHSHRKQSDVAQPATLDNRRATNPFLVCRQMKCKIHKRQTFVLLSLVWLFARARLLISFPKFSFALNVFACLRLCVRVLVPAQTLFLQIQIHKNVF